MLPDKGGWIARATRALRTAAWRYRWEALPYYGAVTYGTAVELHAATGPGWGTPLAYGITAGLSGAAALPLVDRNPAAAYGCASLAAALGWASWQTAAGPGPEGGILLAVATTGLSIPYWRFIASRRDHHADQTTAVEIARYGAIKATAIPAQRPAPAIETAPPTETTPQAGDFPIVPWPGARTGLSITDPIRLSDTTEIVLPGGHVLVGGGTDMGKSGIIHNICCNVIVRADARLWCIDMKPGAVELGIYRHAGARVASTPDAALAMLRELTAEGKRRGDLLGANVGPDGQFTLTRAWKPTPENPQIVLVIDELAELTAACPEAADELRSHTRLLRALGASVIAGSQITSRNTTGGNTDARGQFGTRIGVRVFEPGQTNMIMGQGAHGAGIRLDLLQQPGEFLILSRHHDGKTPDRAYLLTDRDIADHVRAHSTGATTLPVDTEPAAFAEPAAPAEPAFETTGSVTGDILAYLKNRSATPKEVASAIGGKPDAVRARMSQLAAQQQLTKDAQGRYRATKAGAVIAGNVIRFHQRAKP